MNEKAYAAYQVIDGKFMVLNHGAGFPDSLATRLWFNRPTVDSDTALAKFYRSNLDESPVELTPIPNSTFTQAYFWRSDMGGLTLIVGRYW